MNLFVVVTEGDRYELQANQPGLDEVNHDDNLIAGGRVGCRTLKRPHQQGTKK